MGMVRDEAGMQGLVSSNKPKKNTKKTPPPPELGSGGYGISYLLRLGNAS